MRRSRQSGRTFARAALVGALLLMGSAAAAQENLAAPPATPNEQVPDAGVQNTDSAEDEASDADRKRKLRLAILTGGLIAVTGLALVLLTILGGSATRRGLRRKPLRESPPPPAPLPAERFDDQAPETLQDDREAGSEEEGAHPGADGERP